MNQGLIDLIQNALPSLTSDEREALMTGMCPSCWEKMFAGTTEEDEDDMEADERE
jgi:hypothetical protein